MDLLLLADMHNAAKLKAHLFNFIAEARVAEEKEDLEKLKKNPDLLAEVFVKCTRYLDNFV